MCIMENCLSLIFRDFNSVPFDLTDLLQEQVKDAYMSSQKLRIQGSTSKTFLGNESTGNPITTFCHKGSGHNGNAHSGIVHYEPTELVITARSGTTLNEIEQTLAENQQMLAFEPPHFGENATLGGTIACGLSGPGRAKYGAARDFVLGTKLINGQGDIVHFGGEVMKNVAGYDISRLQTGAMGTLGLLLEISLKVLPVTDFNHTLVITTSQESAFDIMIQSAELPVTATAYVEGKLYLRVSSCVENTIDRISQQLGGELLENGALFWISIREHQHHFFKGAGTLWRISVPPATPPIEIHGQWLTEWNGAQRWLLTNATAQQIRALVKPLDGHATLYYKNEGCKKESRNKAKENQAFQPLPEPLMKLHRQIKHAMDPNGIFNPGRMYPEL